MRQEPICVGIDVSKSRLDVSVRPGGDGWNMADDEAGIRNLAFRLQFLGPAAVLLRFVPGVAGALRDNAGASAGTGNIGPEADCRLGGSGSHQPGQRADARQAVRLGRPDPGEGCPLQGGIGRQPVQSGAPRLVSRTADDPQAQEDRPLCLYAQAAHHPQCYGEERSVLEFSGRLALTPKTVAGRLRVPGHPIGEQAPGDGVGPLRIHPAP